MRELINAVEYAVNLEEGELIDLGSLPRPVQEGSSRMTAVPNREGRWLTLEQLEREAIIGALDHFGWNEHGKIKAARALGISRATICRKIAKYKLHTRMERGTITTKKALILRDNQNK